MVEGLHEIIAEFHSINHAQNVTRGMKLNAEKGLYNGGIVPLGYYIDKEQHFQIDGQQAQTVNAIFEMYVKGSTMKGIIQHLNRLQVKTSRGNEFNKNSIRRILMNKRYIGHYIFKDYDVPDSLPRIVSDELFNKAQSKLEKNKKTPARAKAKATYLLTTKLFCGTCNSVMVGVSGTGKMGKPYFYYACTKRENKACKRKGIRKEHLERMVVSETKKLLTNKNINIIAKEIVALCKKENNTPVVQRLKRLIKENENATKNLIKALELGEAADIITKTLVQKKAERDELEKQLVQENIKYPKLTLDQVTSFLNQFKNGSINDDIYRALLIDLFV